MSYTPSFGEIIIQKRMEQGLTLRGLAEKLEISAPYLCDMEKNRRQPPEKTLLDKLADTLCMTESERTHIPSPYVAMSQSFGKQANNLWYQIYQVVRENCASDYKGKTPHDDMMERLLSARRGG